MDIAAVIKAIDGIGARDWIDYASLVLNAIGLFVAVGTLIFAVYIYRRFSLRQQLLEKQKETVFDLVHCLQNTTFHFGIKGLNDGSKTTYGHFAKFFDLKNKDMPRLQGALSHKEKLLVTIEAFEEWQFTQFVNNPFTPRSIAAALDPFILNGPLVQCNGDDFPKLVTLLSYNAYNDKNRIGKDSPTKHLLYQIEGCPITKDFNSFHKACTELSSKINEWLAEFGAADLNLR